MGGTLRTLQDGTTAEADVLVAADGVNSRVRQQYLPHAEPVDTGVITLGGKIPLTDGALALLPPRLLDGPVIAMPPEECNLFMAVWKRAGGRRTVPAAAGDRGKRSGRGGLRDSGVWARGASTSGFAVSR